MNKKKYIFCILNLLITLAYIIFCHTDFISNGKVNFIRVGFTAVTAVLICVAAVFKLEIKNKKIKTGIWGILFLIMPLLLLAVVMQNYHIMMIRAWLINYSLYFMLITVFFAVTGRYSVAVITSGLIVLFAYAVNTEVTLFRGAPVVPSDIYSLRTAISVSENYSFKLTYQIFSAFQGTLLTSVVAIKMNVKISKIRWRIVSIALAAVALCCWFAFISAYFEKTSPTKLKYERYDTYLSNERFGTLPTFLYNAENMIIKKPEGYSKESAEQIMQSISDGSEGEGERPNIVVIMDESFSDITTLYGIETNVPMLENYHALTDDAIKGNMYVSVYGGNTCVTEFEFLTGLTAGVLDDDTVAYTQCIRKPVHSLCNDLKDIGYKTIAIHPYWKNSWNRGTVYPLLGFDETIFAENFGTNDVSSVNFLKKPNIGDYDYIRGYLSDEDCFKKVEEQFENKAEDERLFVFNVTIQNHGGYNIKNFKSDVTATSLKSSSVNQYLTLANKTDEALAGLIDYFKNYDEPTVIVYFGDHQPSLNFKRNTCEEYKYLGDNSKYLVPFAIWSNYDIEEKEVEVTSPVYLSLLLKETAKLPETKWDVFRKQLMEKYPTLTLRGAYDNDKNSVKKSEIDDNLYNQYKVLEYGMLFDEITP
jgi:phosphoglycerol transferase MdoB-like AlkP superfamily enzyme